MLFFFLKTFPLDFLTLFYSLFFLKFPEREDIKAFLQGALHLLTFFGMLISSTVFFEYAR